MDLDQVGGPDQIARVDGAHDLAALPMTAALVVSVGRGVGGDHSRSVASAARGPLSDRCRVRKATGLPRRRRLGS